MSEPQHSQSSELVGLNTSQVAERWGVSVQTVKREIACGNLPSFRVRGSVRVRLTDVEAAMMPDHGDVDDLDAYVKRLVDAAPRLTKMQRQRLAAIIQAAS